MITNALTTTLAPTPIVIPPVKLPVAGTHTKRQPSELTVLSFGAGQESTALLYLLIYSAAFRARYAPGTLICVFSDTMDEHIQTYQHIEQVKLLCQQHNILFVHLLPSMGYHGWEGLREFYRRTNTVGSKCFMKTCTDNLKLTPIYNFLEGFVGRKYNLPTGNKQGLVHFAKKLGKIHVLVGISRGEEKRMADPAKEKKKWKRESITTVYPLVEMGMDRGDCQRCIRAFGHEVPLPSNCILCPFLSEIELVWLYKIMPEDYREWVELERRKIEKFADKGDKNYGVWGKKLLPEVLEGALAKYGHLSDSELWDFKMSHGHCVASKY
jgi:3'-phosphoadenosine 5'-phosphosulfate sulfotransferase (PAPS reductase)/FAD synthetase